MTRENAILCLKGIKNYGRDTFTEQSDWQESLDIAIKALEREPCEDCVRRREVLDVLKDEWNKFSDANDAMQESIDTIEALKPVTPKQEPKSEWQKDHEILKAYSDGANEVLDKIRAEIMQLDYNLESVEYDHNDMAMTEEVHMICQEEVLQIIDKYNFQ